MIGYNFKFFFCREINFSQSFSIKNKLLYKTIGYEIRLIIDKSFGIMF